MNPNTQFHEFVGNFTVDSFCKAHGISRAFFYVLLKEGSGPDIVKLRNRTLITTESAARWRKSLDGAA